MIRTPLISAITSDLAGKVRGKAFPADQLAGRAVKGVGWTPTNVQITCFDRIAPSPFGALGDLVLIPDPDSGVTVDFGDGTVPERFMLGDIRTLEGAPWECCTRGILRAALARLEALGLRLRGAFEHEFQLADCTPPPGWAYTLAGFRAQADFCETLMAALGAAGLTPDTIMKEYGVNQYEVTIGPETGLRIADAAVILRELTYSAARRHGDRATFTPIRDPAGVGNGVHVHLSLTDRDGRPVTWDAGRPYGLSAVAGSFVAGILRHVGSLVALTAPSAISYTRLTPHRWSAAYNNLGFRDREATVRICPVSGSTPEAIARGYNVEYRAADAAASPHLTLAALVHAGAQGIEDGLPAPEATTEDLSVLAPETLAARGLARLPPDLADALDRFEADGLVRGWFPEGFAAVYLAHKRGELAAVADMSPAERYAAYATVY
jgi:glutamine synthetase